ncbi:MAG: thermonuclease family protein [Thermoguttaceae bacterium]
MARKFSRSLTSQIRRPLAVVGLLLLFVLLRVLAPGLWPPPPPEPLPESTYRVQRVVDGDTLLLEDGVRVRLIGADTPETVKPGQPVEPFGPEATRYTRQFVDDAGGLVRLRMDRERTDRYERLLAYVLAGDRMLNEELIRQGLARARTEFNYSPAMKRRFHLAEDEAKSAGRGIWSSNSP